MIFFTLLASATRRLFRQWMAWILLYGLFLAGAVLLAMVFRQTLEQQIGESAELDRLFPAFDYATFSDFLRGSGRAFRVLLPQILLAVAVLTVVGMWFAGAVMASANPKKPRFSFKTFFWGGFRYWFPFLFIQLCYYILVAIGLVVLLLAAIGLSVLYWEEVNWQETYYIYTYAAGIVLGWLWATYWLAGADAAKAAYVVHPELGWWRALRSGPKSVRRKGAALWWLFLLSYLLGVGIISAYWWADAALGGMISWENIVILAVLQQGVVFTRLGLQLWEWVACVEWVAAWPPAVRKRKAKTQQAPTPDFSAIPPQTIIVYPNAKINFGLNVVHRREDGYHELQSCFYPVGWRDVLEITPAQELSFQSTGIPIPGEPGQNLVEKAWQILHREKGIPPVAFHLHKQVPIGAGLGGGSADGAFALKALNEYFALGYPDEALRAFAKQLGSDCPFFISNEPRYVTGTGDVFEELALDLRGSYLVLCNPGIHIGTKEAYSGIVPQAPLWDTREVLEGDKAHWRDRLHNDFENHLFEKYPELAALKQSFYEAGAWYASMTGSGSTVFGLFDREVDFHPPIEGTAVWKGFL